MWISPSPSLYIGVRNIPGAIVITLIPYFPSSLARGNVIPFIAPLVEPYAAWSVYPSNPYTLDILIITPLSLNSPIYYCILINYAACFTTLRVPITLTSNTFLISFVWTVVPSFLTRRPVAWTIPAEFTTRCRQPNLYFIYIIKFFMDSSSLTSV